MARPAIRIMIWLMRCPDRMSRAEDLCDEEWTMKDTLNRRDFLRQTAVAGFGAGLAGLAVSGCADGLRWAAAPADWSDKPKDLVKVGFVGIGNQGRSHVGNLLKIEGCRITAVCDILPERAQWASKQITAAGHPEPAVYTSGERDFARMCKTEDLDLVYTVTPWQWHTPVCVAAMENGKHAASEVPIATSLEECWQLVETAEKTRRYCIMMENCCYDYQEMVTLNMIRQGLLGEILHAECGYLHDLREHKLAPTTYQGMWRLDFAIRRDGNPYPTHGIGPVAWCMDINRGDAFDYLVSVSTKSVGLNLYARRKYPKWANQKFKLGDVNTSVIHTVAGKTILVKHGTHLPRPYSRDFLIQGTTGIVCKYPTPLVYVEGKSPSDQWEDMEPYSKKYEHPVWTSLAQKSQGAGHGGMDYIEDYRLIESLRKGEPLDQDVYDAAAWSAIVEASCRSVARKGKPVDIPDFTRGRWKTNPPLGIITPA